MTPHELAWCQTCRWASNGPDAHRAARRHTISHILTETPHPTVTKAHPRHLCSPECRTEKETSL